MSGGSRAVAPGPLRLASGDSVLPGGDGRDEGAQRRPTRVSLSGLRMCSQDDRLDGIGFRSNIRVLSFAYFGNVHTHVTWNVRTSIVRQALPLSIPALWLNFFMCTLMTEILIPYLDMCRCVNEPTQSTPPQLTLPTTPR